MTAPTLHDRLADLADAAPPGGPAPDLWDRGRRLHRRRRAGTVVIIAVVVLALGVLGASTWLRGRTEPAPASPTGAMRLPDHLYAPSSRLDGTDAVGPIGPASAVIYAPRDVGFGELVNGLVGVSAGTGEYRFLDLPDWPDVGDSFGSSSVALSDDGRRVAYWYGERDEESDTEQWRIDGVRVYDTLTGDVQSQPLSSPYGIAQEGLVWVGDEVWFGASEHTGPDRTGGREEVVSVWTPGEGLTRTWREQLPSLVYATGSVEALVEGSERDVRAWTSGRSGPDAWRADRPLEGQVWYSPNGSRLAAVLDPDGPANSDTVPRGVAVLVPRAGEGVLSSTLVPGVETNEVAGWRDKDHVVTFDYRDGTYRSVDVETGGSSELTTTDAGLGASVMVAQDAWAAPTFDAPEPPDPLGTGVVVGLSAGILLAGGLGLVWWRRRVRA